MQPVDLAYKQYGETGSHIIILHGLLGTLDNWQTVARHLGDQYRVTSFDLRNHGRSPHSDYFNISLMAADVVSMMEQLHISNAVILGHSMGGKVAMQFALEYGHLTDGLIAVDIAPKWYPRGHDDIFKVLLSIDLQQYTIRKDIEDFIRLSIPDNGTVQFLLKNLSREATTGQFVWKANISGLYHHYEEITKAIEAENSYDGPVLFIRGGKSNYVKDSDLSAIKSLFPSVELETVPNAGHWLHADQPDATIALLQKYLKHWKE